MAKLSIYIPDEDLEAVGELASEYGITRNRIIGFSVRYMLWKHKSKELDMQDYIKHVPMLEILGEEPPDQEHIVKKYENR